MPFFQSPVGIPQSIQFLTGELFCRLAVRASGGHVQTQLVLQANNAVHKREVLALGHLQALRDFLVVQEPADGTSLFTLRRWAGFLAPVIVRIDDAAFLHDQSSLLTHPLQPDLEIILVHVPIPVHVQQIEDLLCVRGFEVAIVGNKDSHSLQSVDEFLSGQHREQLLERITGRAKATIQDGHEPLQNVHGHRQSSRGPPTARALVGGAKGWSQALVDELLKMDLATLSRRIHENHQLLHLLRCNLLIQVLRNEGFKLIG
mmetsp:Transcript_36341/g.95357  ORF Transcript_36341/g.95357 Transcript_36341/m.95357 type:complete len:260 (-) Transcript_36341:886-1665(-)